MCFELFSQWQSLPYIDLVDDYFFCWIKAVNKFIFDNLLRWMMDDAVNIFTMHAVSNFTFYNLLRRSPWSQGRDLIFIDLYIKGLY